MRDQRKNIEKSSAGQGVAAEARAEHIAAETPAAEAPSEPAPRDEATDTDIQIMVFSCPVDHQGATVHVKGWVRSNSLHPPVVFVHDLGENIGLYRRAAHELVAAGYSVYGFDLRGHGLSGPTLGHIQNFSALVNDLLQVVAWIRFKSFRRHPIIIGQGLGALITIYFQRAYPKFCPGAVLVAPYLNINIRTSAHKRFLIKRLAEMAPRMRLPAAMAPGFMAHHAPHGGPQDSASAEQFHGITTNFANELLGAINGAPDEFSRLDCPALILCPDRDSFCDSRQLRAIVEAHPYRDKISIEGFSGGGHHLLTGEPAPMSAAIRRLIPWLHDVGSAS